MSLLSNQLFKKLVKNVYTWRVLGVKVALLNKVVINKNRYHVR